MTLSSAPRLAFATSAAVACDSAFCRQGGALWVTVVVKATFELIHGEAARLVAPEPVRTADEPRAGGGSLLHARENAPHVPGAGVVLSGRACAPAGKLVPSMSVRLGISRDRPLIDKTLHVFGARSAASPSAVTPFQKIPLVYERAFGGPGVSENPVGTGAPGSPWLPNLLDPRAPRRPAGFGPLAGSWTPRRAFLGGADPGLLEQPVLEVPPGFDWRCFQPAPADQQLDALQGDEWIVLDGMHPAMPRLQTRLPRPKAHARRVPVGGGEVQPITLRADMLVIDADRGVASLVWRGRFVAPPVDALPSIVVQACLELPGRSPEWPVPLQAASGFMAETWEVDLAAILGSKLPFGADRGGAPPKVAGSAPRSQPFSTGTATVDVAAILGRPTPFHEAADNLPAPAKRESTGAPVQTATTTEIAVLHAHPLPFAPAAPDRTPAESIPARPETASGSMSTVTAESTSRVSSRRPRPSDRHPSLRRRRLPPRPPSRCRNARPPGHLSPLCPSPLCPRRTASATPCSNGWRRASL
jgi:hypothetical protein